MKENISESLKKGINSTLKSLKRKMAETLFLSQAKMFCVISQDKSKVFYGVLDESTNTLYVRSSKEKFFKENIFPNDLIEDDEENKSRYKVVECDFNNSFDYLVKVKEQYHTVKCFRIQLENVAK